MAINIPTESGSAPPQETGDAKQDFAALKRWVMDELRNLRNDVAEVARAARFDTRKKIRVKVDRPGEVIRVEHGLGRVPTGIRTQALDADATIGRAGSDLGDNRVLVLKTSPNTPRGAEFDIEVD